MTGTSYFESTGLDARLQDSVLLVTLNRPTRANALDAELMSDLTELWTRVDADRELRCVVITGAGKAFCAGADMSLLSAPREHIGDDAAEELAFLPGARIGIPVIVAVNGTCAGGGLHFVGDADITIASEKATFVDPHVSVGQVSALEPLELMLRMRRDRAVRMALLGRHEVLDAATALEAGLVSEVLTAEELLPRALELAGMIASGSPEAVRLTRRVIRQFEADLLGRHPDLGWELIQRHWAHPDSKEGPAAFLQKRAPRWQP